MRGSGLLTERTAMPQSTGRRHAESSAAATYVQGNEVVAYPNSPIRPQVGKPQGLPHTPLSRLHAPIGVANHDVERGCQCGCWDGRNNARWKPEGCVSNKGVVAPEPIQAQKLIYWQSRPRVTS